MDKLERFDNFYVTIAQETGGINGLFESLFSFLLRRTDFFYESEPGDKMGFPPGMSMKIVYEIFQKYQNEHYKKHPKKDIQEYNQKLEKLRLQQEQLKQQELIKQQEKQQQEALKQEEIKKKQAEVQQQKQMKNEQVIEEKQQIEEKNENSEQSKIEKTQNQNEDNVQKKISDISTYNGGENDKYKWAQSISDLTVQFDLPKNTKAKDINVDFQQNFVSIKIKDQVLIEGQLSEKIKVEDSFWNIEDGVLLIMTLEKFNENIWKTIFKGDKEIDATKVDNSKHLHQFDDETQGALRKIMYEQDRKMRGLPTTEEEQQQELLRKAWDAEGSPFKGTPFDASKFNLGQNQFSSQ